MPRQLSRFKTAIFSLLMVLIPLTVLFICYGLWASRTPPMSDFEKMMTGGGLVDMRRRAPYVMFRSEPNKADYNSLGFRNPELPYKKELNEFRIAMLGGSAVVATGTSPERTLPGVLASVIQEHVPEGSGIKVTYINAGIASSISSQELAEFIYNVLPFEIDLLIVYDGFNDMYCPLNAYDPRPGYPYDYLVQEYRYYHYTEGRTLMGALSSLLTPLKLANPQEDVIAAYTKAMGLNRPDFPQLKQQIMDTYFKNMDIIKRIADAHGIKSAFFLQPYSKIKNYHPYGSKTVDELNDVYAAMAEAYHAREIDPAKYGFFKEMVYFGDKLEPHFSDVVHVHDYANKFIANELYNHLSNANLIEFKTAGSTK